MEKENLDLWFEPMWGNIKKKIPKKRFRDPISSNRELLSLYYQLGTRISKGEEKFGWRDKHLKELSDYLHRSCPNVRGFSVQNLRFMRRLSREYSPEEFQIYLQEPLPWGHTIVLMLEVENRKARHFYKKWARFYGWPRHLLLRCIRADLYARERDFPLNDPDFWEALA